MIRGRRPRWFRGAVLLAVVPWLVSLAGCTRGVDGIPTAGPASSLPASAGELGELVVPEVASGLPRLPDEDLDPPAGAKDVADVASYADDPERELEVLADFGYRFGWERFWGEGPTRMTGVFVDQFETRAGAGAYAADLARNDAEHYGAELVQEPADLPGGCRLLSVEDPAAHSGLTGPAALVWCGSGVFSVGVTAVSGSVEDAEDEVRAVLAEQLDRLPPR